MFITTEEERRAGPLWFKRWRLLQRRAIVSGFIAVAATLFFLTRRAELSSLGQAVLLVLVVGTGSVASLTAWRATYVVPESGAAWLGTWRRYRRQAAVLIALGTFGVLGGASIDAAFWPAVRDVVDYSYPLRVASCSCGAVSTKR